MKVLVFVSVFIYLFGTATALECYKCDDFGYHECIQDDDDDCKYMACEKTTKTTTCRFSQTFCFTIEYVSSPFEGLAFEKNCDWLHVCKSVGPFKIKHPYYAQNIVGDCCQGDFCNRPQKYVELNSSHPVMMSSSCQNKLSNRNYLFLSVYSSFFISVFL